MFQTLGVHRWRGIEIDRQQTEKVLRSLTEGKRLYVKRGRPLGGMKN